MTLTNGGYAAPQMDVIVFNGSEVFCDKFGVSMNGVIDNGDIIPGDNGDHTGPDGGWNGDLEID